MFYLNIVLLCVENQRDGTLLMNNLYYPLIGSTCSRYQASLAVALQQLDSPDSTNIPMHYAVYEMMLLMMDW